MADGEEAKNHRKGASLINQLQTISRRHVTKSAFIVKLQVLLGVAPVLLCCLGGDRSLADSSTIAVTLHVDLTGEWSIIEKKLAKA